MEGRIEADICFALGGDGTILTALRRYAGTGVPVFAVNFGEIGFLATVDRESRGDGHRGGIRGELRGALAAGDLAVGAVAGVAGHQRRLDAPPAGQPRRRPRLRGGRRRDRAGALRRAGRRHPRRLDRLQPGQRRPGDGLGRGRLRGVVHRAALADRPGAGGRADRRADRAQPLTRGVGRRHRRRPPGVHAAPGRGDRGAVRRRAGVAWPRSPARTSTTACARSSAGCRRCGRPGKRIRSVPRRHPASPSARRRARRPASLFRWLRSAPRTGLQARSAGYGTSARSAVSAARHGRAKEP